MYFGKYTDSPCTLNWGHFIGFSVNDKNEFWVQVVSHFVVLFPALDVLSVFPLNIITLGNNLTVAILSPKNAAKRSYNVFFRLIAAIIPLVGATIVSDLDILLQFTGAIGIAIEFLIPALLVYKSKQVCIEILTEENNINKRKCYETPFTSWYSNDYIVKGGIVVCVLLAFTSLVSAVANVLSGYK